MRSFEQLKFFLYNSEDVAKVIDKKKKENWLLEKSYKTDFDKNHHLIILYRYLHHADGYYAIISSPYFDEEIGPFKSELAAQRATVAYDEEQNTIRYVYYSSEEKNKFDSLVEKII